MSRSKNSFSLLKKTALFRHFAQGHGRRQIGKNGFTKKMKKGSTATTIIIILLIIMVLKSVQFIVGNSKDTSFKSKTKIKNMADKKRKRSRVKGHYRRVGLFGVTYVRPHLRKPPRSRKRRRRRGWR